MVDTHPRHAWMRAKRPASDFDFLFDFPWRTHTETVKGRAGGLRRGVSAMDGAIEPYLMKICQRRCREPAWA
ncbi:hypothetical protein, partial [Stenotrophomonas maltophilia]